ncbi:MAG: hypothetical protein ABW007_20705 [Chitinophagaceae bacterium]
MLKKITVLFLLCYSGMLYAQGGTPFLSDANGRLITLRNAGYKADGSPYLFDDYYPSDITFQNGKVYKNIKSKFNVSENQLIFLDDAGNEMVAATPIKSLKITKPDSVQLYLESPGTSINLSRAPVYQVLVNNEKLKLLKQIVITFSESRQYGDGEMTRIYKRRESYFAAFPGQAPQKFEKNKNAVAAIFGDKQQQISAYIDQQKFRFKTDADLINIFEYFLTLK